MPVTRSCRHLLILLVLAPVMVFGLPAASYAAQPGAAQPGTALPDIRTAADARSLITSAPVLERSRRTSRAAKIRRTVRIAKNQIGDPYRYGAAGPHRFDCSGLVYFSARRAGFSKVPRTSRAQARHMRRIKKSNMRPGDFMYFHNGGRVYHTGIFVGRKDGKRIILHAPSTGKRVHKARVWTSKWFAGTLRR